MADHVHHEPHDLPRRLTRRRLLVLGAGGAGALLLAACGGVDPTPTAAPAATGGGGGAAATPPPVAGGTGAATPVPNRAAGAAGDLKKGGVLKVAVIGEPPAVADAMFTTATITGDVAAQIFEGLFARDTKFQPRPMLVDTHTVTPDGKSYEFVLRKGVKFHNGKELTAADVVASLKRWGQLTGRGKLIFGRLDRLEAKDAGTVTMTFKEPTGVLVDFLSRGDTFIMPAEIADAAGKEKLNNDQFIGTGPYTFKEHQVDRFIRLTRYDGYAAREDQPDGFAGRKVAYVDEIRVIPVPDDSVRLNGLITGEYHFAESVPPDQYDTLKADPNLEPLIVKPGSLNAVHFNKKQGPFTDPKLRQAVALAFSMSEAMVAGFGRQEFIRLNPSIAADETPWYSEIGKDVYNKPNPEQARALLREAGYTGQPIRWLTTKEYAYMYNMAEFIKQKLDAVGMPVELVVSDWATLIKNRANPEMYEIFITGHPSNQHPVLQVFNDKSWPGFWDSAEKDRLIGAMVAEPDPGKQKQLVDDYQGVIWKEMAFIKCGESFGLRAARKEVKGQVSAAETYYWNVALS